MNGADADATGELQDALPTCDPEDEERCLVCRAGRCLGVAQLAGSEGTNCALLDTGEVYCWGDTTSRQIVGVSANRAAPTRVWGPPRSPAVEIELGAFFGCLRVEGGEVYCWGRNAAGQSGQRSQATLGGLGESDAKYFTALPVKVAIEDAIDIDAGPNNVCAIRSDHTLWCWGRLHNGEGWLGDDGAYTQSWTPVRVAELEVDDVASTESASCALTTEGALMCWGDRGCGVLGVPDAESSGAPIAAQWSGEPAQALWAGADHVCATRAEGEEVFCWGCSQDGQTAQQSGTSVEVPADRSNVFDEPVQSMALGWQHSCALTANGAVLCWGNNNEGQLGRPGDSTALPLVVEGLGVSQVLGVGRRGACAANAAGVVRCWGKNKAGGADPSSVEAIIYTPTVVQAAYEPCRPGQCAVEGGGCVDTGDPHPERPCEFCGATGEFDACFACRGGACVPVEGVAAGSTNSCAWLETGEVVCWGTRGLGLTGDNVAGLAAPTQVPAMPAGVKRVKVGGSHACALTEGGELYCWGDNAYTQVGIVGSKVVTTPTLVSTGGEVVDFDLGNANASCAVLTDGEVRCWGTRLDGQGYDDKGNYTTWEGPTVIEGVAALAVEGSLTVGHYHACARIGAAPGAACWGAGGWGALANGSTDNQVVAAAISDPSGGAPELPLSALVVGTEFGCLVDAPGTGIWCWGAGPNAQNAHPEFLTQYVASRRWESFPEGEIAQLAAGWRFGCAIMAGSGEVWCWGVDFTGELGAAHETRHPVALRHRLVPPQRQLALGRNHACAVDDHHVVRCWGSNLHGQLGGGIYAERPPTPDPVVVEWKEAGR